MSVKPIANKGNQGGIQMWPSEELANRLYDIANIGLVVGLVIGIVSTVGLVWTGNVKERYLRTQLADTQKETAQALREAEKLRSESQPRRLTGVQKDKLRALLAAGQPDHITVVSRVMDSESLDFADDLAAVLREANWDVARIKNLQTFRRGVSLGTVSAALNALPPVKLLDGALTAIGVPHRVDTFMAGALTMPSRPIQIDVLYLVIGEHPPLPTPR
jgi:hypothetical protein